MQMQTLIGISRECYTASNIKKPRIKTLNKKTIKLMEMMLDGEVSKKEFIKNTDVNRRTGVDAVLNNCPEEIGVYNDELFIYCLNPERLLNYVSLEKGVAI